MKTKHFKNRIIATLLFICIIAGSITSLSATQAEASEKLITRMSFIEKVVKKMGLDYKNADANAVMKYKKMFTVSKTNAKYIAAAVKAGIMTETQWKTVRKKLSYKEMALTLVKADEYLWGEWVSEEHADWLKVYFDNIRDNNELSKKDKILLYKAYILGYAESYSDIVKKKDNGYTYDKQVLGIRLDDRVSFDDCMKAIDYLETLPESWYTAFIPSTVQLNGTTPAQAYCNRINVIGKSADLGDGRYASEYNVYFRPYVTLKDVKWSSSNGKIVTVDNDGIMHGKKKGTAIVTCKIRNTIYSQEVTVKNPETTDEYMSCLGARKALEITREQWSGFHFMMTSHKDLLQLSSFKADSSVRNYPFVIGQNESWRASAQDIMDLFDGYYTGLKLNINDTIGYEWVVIPIDVFNELHYTASLYVENLNYSYRKVVDLLSYNLCIGVWDIENQIKINDYTKSTFSLKWNGKVWDKCEFYESFEASCPYMRAENNKGVNYLIYYFVKVPKDYSDLIITFSEFSDTKDKSDPLAELKRCKLYCDIKVPDPWSKNRRPLFGKMS